jgi:hypothetical protein
MRLKFRNSAASAGEVQAMIRLLCALTFAFAAPALASAERVSEARAVGAEHCDASRKDIAVCAGPSGLSLIVESHARATLSDTQGGKVPLAGSGKRRAKIQMAIWRGEAGARPDSLILTRTDGTLMIYRLRPEEPCLIGRATTLADALSRADDADAGCVRSLFRRP